MENFFEQHLLNEERELFNENNESYQELINKLKNAEDSNDRLTKILDEKSVQFFKISRQNREYLAKLKDLETEVSKLRFENDI